MMILNLLNKLTLDVIKEACANKDAFTLASLGLSLTDAEKISQLKNDELELIKDCQLNCINIVVDLKTITNVVTKKRQDEHYKNTIEKAIRLGATYEVMRIYAKMTKKQFSDLRKNVDVKNNGNIRLNDDEVNHIESALNIKNIKDKQIITIEYLIDIAEKSNIGIGGIYQYLQENWMSKYEFKK